MHTFKQCDYYNVIRTAEEEARERGHAIGLAEGRAEGREEGLSEGRAEGRAEGRVEGLVEGRAIEKRENIQSLLKAGVTMETIATALNLTEEEVHIYAESVL
jgi:predicted transposase YdaD